MEVRRNISIVRLKKKFIQEKKRKTLENRKKDIHISRRLFCGQKEKIDRRVIKKFQTKQSIQKVDIFVSLWGIPTEKENMTHSGGLLSNIS